MYAFSNLNTKHTENNYIDVYAQAFMPEFEGPIDYHLAFIKLENKR